MILTNGSSAFFYGGIGFFEIREHLFSSNLDHPIDLGRFFCYFMEEMGEKSTLIGG